MCLKFFKNKIKKKFKKKKIKKKRSETYLKNSPDLSPLLSINGVKISNIERNIYENRDYEKNPLLTMETLSGSLSPPKDYPSIYRIGDCDEDSSDICSDDSMFFPEPELK
jgi:hypothetical protein